jgi:RNA polymerase sigma-70 factor (ECF subfamily)
MTVQQLDFARALRGAQTGDNDAFCDLWRITNPILLRYLRITAPELADDVASATWVKIARRLPSVTGDRTSLHIRLVRIARDEVAVRRRISRRHPDPIIGPVRAETGPWATARCADTGPDQPPGEALTSEQAVRLASLLPADVAEMVALRLVVGLTAAETATVLGLRCGSVIVAVHGGLRRTGSLVAASGRSTGGPNPWELDRLIDLGRPGQGELDWSIRTVVSALRAPGEPGDLAQLAAAQVAYQGGRHRRFAVAPAFLVPLVIRRLGAARSVFTRKVGVAVLGTALLSTPAGALHSAAQESHPPRRLPAAAGAEEQPLSAHLTVARPALLSPAAADPAAFGPQVRLTAPRPGAATPRIARQAGPPVSHQVSHQVSSREEPRPGRTAAPSYSQASHRRVHQATRAAAGQHRMRHRTQQHRRQHFRPC